MSKTKNLPAFEIDAPDEIEWPVTVSIPASGGTFADFRFTGVFRLLPESEYAALLGGGRGDEAEGVRASLAEVLEGNVEKLAGVITDWKGIRRGGVELPFSVDQLRAQLTGKYGRALATGINTALSEIRLGARLGN